MTGASVPYRQTPVASQSREQHWSSAWQKEPFATQQRPLAQAWPKPQALSQAPQCRALVWRSTRAPAQRTRLPTPTLHSQVAASYRDPSGQFGRQTSWQTLVPPGQG